MSAPRSDAPSADATGLLLVWTAGEPTALDGSLSHVYAELAR